MHMNSLNAFKSVISSVIIILGSFGHDRSKKFNINFPEMNGLVLKARVLASISPFTLNNIHNSFQ